MFAILFVVLALSLSYLYWYQRDRRLPPGPKGIPILGTLPFLTIFPPKQLQKWGFEYGGIYTWRCGRDDIVVLTDYDIANELYRKQGNKIITRPPFHIFDQSSRGDGLTFAKPVVWEPHRRFVSTTLRKFLAGKKLAEHITVQAEYLLDQIRDASGELLDPAEFFWLSTINVGMSVIASKRFDFSDKELHLISEALSAGFSKYSEEIFLLYNFPSLRFVPGFAGIQRNYIKENHYLFDVFKDLFREHEKSFDENDIRDIMDAFTAEMRKNGGKDSFNERQISVLAKDLLDGATHTLASTLRWLMVASLRYPEYQKRLHDEIDAVIGENEAVTAAHREQMPQVIAFISEVMRRCTILASSQVSATKDLEAAGFKIPEGTPIALIMWSIHHDPKNFKDPFEFLPERFIDPEDGKYVKPRYFIPFSIGRRNCVGDSLAQLEVFVFFVSILRRFELQVDDVTILPEFDGGTCGIIYMSPPFKLRFIERS